MTVIQFVLALAMIAAVPVTCNDGFDAPGQGNYRATLTLINRTQADVTLFTQNGQTTVAPCEEVTLAELPINSWQLTSPGRDMIHSGGGHAEAHSYLIVTKVVTQIDARPPDLPPCVGLLQPGG